MGLPPMSLEEAIELECAIDATKAEIKELDELTHQCNHCECSSIIQRITRLKGHIEMMQQARADKIMEEGMEAL